MGQVRKIKAGLVKIPIDQFVGEDGHIFFDTDDGTLRLSDGVTPGGSILSSAGGGSGLQLGTTAATALAGNTALFDGVYDSLTSKPTLFSGDYGDLTNQPTIPTDYGDHSTQGYLTSYTETDPIVGAVTGIVKADGAGNISAAVAGTDYLTTVAFADVTSTPTTIAGYGITDAFDGAFASLTSTPTTIAGYGITDALALGTTSTTALAGDTALFSGDYDDLSNKPTLLQIGTTSTTALAGNTPYITLGDLSIGAPNATENGGIAYDNSTGTFTYYRQTHLVNSAASDDIEIGSTNQAGEINIGMSTLAHTINIGKGQTGSGTTRTINVGTTGTTGSTQNIHLGYVNSSYAQKLIKIGNASQSAGTNSQIDMYGEILMLPGDNNNAFTIGGQNQTGTITLGQSANDQTISIATNPSASDKTKTINIGTGNTTGGTTAINIGPSSAATTTNTNIYGNAMHQGGLFEFRTTATAASTVDQVVNFAAQDAYGNYPQAGEIVVYGVTNAPSRMVIGYSGAGMTFFDGFGARYIQPASTSTGLSVDNSVDFGSYNARWKIGRFASGTTTLSDRNEKRDIEELNEAELRVATACKGLLRKYRMIEAYETKGDDARIHFGIIAQDLDDAFTAEGLDAHRYAMFMEDTWYDIGDGVAYPSLDDISEEDRENAVEKTKLGVRYEQVLAFIIAAI